MTRDEIIQALATASSFEEQVSLVAALDAQDDGIRTTAAAERSIDWADTVVRQILAPRRTLDRHTASSDWLGEMETTQGNHHQAVIAEASLWFQRLDGDVKADAHEFTEQARGIARRTAGKYGEQAEEAAEAFVAYAAFLNRQVLAASGLDQVQQLVNPHEDPAQTPLPQDVFDNFAPPVHEINVGIDGTQVNSLAPGAEEAVSGAGAGGGVGRPSEHDEGQAPTSMPEYMPSSGRTGSLITDMVGSPSVAIGYTANLNEFLAAEETEGEGDGEDDGKPFPGAAEPFGKKSSREAGGADPFGRGRRAARGGANPTPAAPKPRRAAPSQAPPHHTTRRDVPQITTEAASGLDQVQQTVNPHEDPAPTSLPLDVMWPVDQPWPEQDTGTGQPSRHDAARKQADMFNGGDTPHAVPGGETPVANNPGTTPPRADSGDFNKGITEGRADAAAGEAPSFADASSAVSEYVRGYAQGFGEGGQQPITTPDVPASMGGDAGQAENAARIERSVEKPLVMAGLTVSASLITKDITKDEDFQRGYTYARAWQPGVDIVSTGSIGEEAGIYAGVTDNSVHQKAWVSAHHAMAKRHPELGERIQRHKQVTAQLQSTRDVLVRGIYVQSATSLDLDTMAPGTSADPNGSTPFMGPGTVPILKDAPGTPAAPGGASPYNGAEPFSAPVVPDPAIQDLAAEPQASAQDKLDVSGDTSMGKSPQSMAFRRKVQSAKLAMRQGNGSK